MYAKTFIPLFKSGIHFLGEGDSGYLDVFSILRRQLNFI